MDSEYSEVPVQSQEAGNVSPQRGTGRKRGRPKGSGTGRGRASKGASPSQSPKPVNKTTNFFLSFYVLIHSFKSLLNAFLNLVFLSNNLQFLKCWIFSMLWGIYFHQISLRDFPNQEVSSLDIGQQPYCHVTFLKKYFQQKSFSEIPFSK